jgi:oligopeptide/dipeptide ABC transporter ATP-binding protein
MAEIVSDALTGPAEELLRIEGLDVEFRVGRGKKLKASDQVSLVIRRGETVGLVGESGSGKSTIGAATLGLVPVKRGSIVFRGEDITHAKASRRRAISKQLQVIFQDPYSSLNPARTIEQTLIEPLLVHRKLGRTEASELVGTMLERVGMPRDAAQRYPAQFSGGQRQRIAIARALMVSPELVICDEAVSALDLSVQAQVLNVLLTLQRELGVSYLFISHDLSVVRHMCERVIVLYRGKIMEQGDAETIHSRPAHPYSQALLSASPIPDPAEQSAQRERIAIASKPSMSSAPLTGCRFANRCPFATAICVEEDPALRPGPTGTDVACHHADEATVAFAESSNRKSTTNARH